MRFRRGYIITQESEPVEQPTVPTTEGPASHYSTTLRLTSTTPTQQILTWYSGFTGTLEGVTVFTDKIDSGDTWSVRLRGRELKDSAFPVANTAQREDYSEPINIGDRVDLFYNSKGSTTKNIDFTPKVRYVGEGY